MAGVGREAADLVLATLAGGRQDPKSLVALLKRQFASLDEESAAEVLWSLIETHRVRVTEDSRLEVGEAVAAS